LEASEQPQTTPLDLNRYHGQLSLCQQTENATDKTRRVLEEGSQPIWANRYIEETPVRRHRARRPSPGGHWWQASLADRSMLGLLGSAAAGPLVLESWAQPSPACAGGPAQAGGSQPKPFRPRRLEPAGDCAASSPPRSPGMAGSPRITALLDAGRRSGWPRPSCWPALITRPSRCHAEQQFAAQPHEKPQPPVVGDRSVTSTAIGSWPRQAAYGAADLGEPASLALIEVQGSLRKPADESSRWRRSGQPPWLTRARSPGYVLRLQARVGRTAPAMRHSLSSARATDGKRLAEVYESDITPDPGWGQTGHKSQVRTAGQRHPQRPKVIPASVPQPCVNWMLSTDPTADAERRDKGAWKCG